MLHLKKIHQMIDLALTDAALEFDSAAAYNILVCSLEQIQDLIDLEIKKGK